MRLFIEKEYFPKELTEEIKQANVLLIPDHIKREDKENSIVVTLPLKYLDSHVVDKVAYKSVDNVILNATQERLLRELRNNPNLTQPQLAFIMGLGKSAIQNNISFLKKNGYIERVGANKRGYWRIKE